MRRSNSNFSSQTQKILCYLFAGMITGAVTGFITGYFSSDSMVVIFRFTLFFGCAIGFLFASGAFIFSETDCNSDCDSVQTIPENYLKLPFLLAFFSLCFLLFSFFRQFRQSDKIEFSRKNLQENMLSISNISFENGVFRVSGDCTYPADTLFVTVRPEKTGKIMPQSRTVMVRSGKYYLALSPLSDLKDVSGIWKISVALEVPPFVTEEAEITVKAVSDPPWTFLPGSYPIDSPQACLSCFLLYCRNGSFEEAVRYTDIDFQMSFFPQDRLRSMTEHLKMIDFQMISCSFQTSEAKITGILKNSRNSVYYEDYIEFILKKESERFGVVPQGFLQK